jgi:mannose-6-phosphate isomerase-like protein (cupin superfamily)
MTRRLFHFATLFFMAPVARLLAAAPSLVQTDSRQIARDYSPYEPIVPASPQILGAGETPWESVQPGLRRKVWFNDRQTMALLEFTRDKPDTAPPSRHYHPHDQMSYVIEGRVRAWVGGEKKELGPGGVFVAPSNIHHGIQVLSNKLVLLDVFTPVRADFRPAS